ncbi:MAG: phosphate transport system permease protein PstA [bacterium]|nr:MAG: phosphate transport system permease protein PstA [bacterium]
MNNNTRKIIRKYFNLSVAGTFICTVLILLILFFILKDIVLNGVGHISWSFLSESPSGGMKGGGIFPAIFGTAALVFIMTIAVVPIGVITAIYLHEYAHNNRLTRIIRLAVNNLAGVPAIVFGLFGLGFFVQFVGKGIDGLFFNNELVFGQPAIIWAALTLALLTMPVVIVATEEALRSIPDEIREASYALGATKFQTITRLVLPNSFSGILTGAILAVSRGAGEVAPILFTGAAYFLPNLPTKLNDQFMELGYHIFVLSTQSPNVTETMPILYSTVLVLLVLTFLLNLAAVLVRYQLRKKFQKYN